MRDPVSELLNHILQLILKSSYARTSAMVTLHYGIQHSIQTGDPVILFG